MFSTPAPFALSLSKGKRGVFQHSPREDMLSSRFDGALALAVEDCPSRGPRSAVTRPRVSVLMSVYNGERYLREAVKSILNQTFTAFEFIIIDDCSTDNTWQILTAYAAQDPRIVLIRNEENFGLTRSLNKGLALALGEYIARQDADDVSVPDRLSTQVCFLKKHPEVGAVGAAVRLIDDKGRLLSVAHPPTDHKTLYAYLLLDNCLCHSTLFARSSLLKQLGGYNPNLPYAQDYDLWWRLSGIMQIRVSQDVLVYWRTGNPHTIGNRRQVEQQTCTLQISLQAIRDVLTEQSFDEEAYARFWWACHGQTDKVLRGDVDRLLPLWQSLASQPAIGEVLGPKLIDFAARLLYSHPHEGVQLLRIAARQFGQAILWPRTVKSLLDPLVPFRIRYIWRYINGIGTQWLGARP